MVEKNRIPLLTSSVPNLSLNDFIINADAAGGEFNADGGFGLETELIASKSRQQIGFSDAGIADQNHLEQVIVIVVRSIRPHYHQKINPLSLTKYSYFISVDCLEI